ncbi:hypothetical protein [Streptomyces pseudovenezuelae]
MLKAVSISSSMARSLRSCAGSSIHSLETSTGPERPRRERSLAESAYQGRRGDVLFSTTASERGQCSQVILVSSVTTAPHGRPAVQTVRRRSWCNYPAVWGWTAACHLLLGKLSIGWRVVIRSQVQEEAQPDARLARHADRTVARGDRVMRGEQVLDGERGGIVGGRDLDNGQAGPFDVRVMDRPHARTDVLVLVKVVQSVGLSPV